MQTIENKNTWKRIRLPKNLFSEQIETFKSSFEVDGDGLKIDSYKKMALENKIDVGNKLEFKGTKDLGDGFKNYINDNYSDGYYIEAKSNSNKLQRINCHFPAEGTQVHNHLIVANEGADLEVVMVFDRSASEKSPVNQTYGMQRVIAKKGSRIKLIKIQQMGETDYFFDMNFAQVDEGATFEVVDVQMGSTLTAASYESILEGRRSRSEVKSVYYGNKNMQQDLSFTMRHRGKHSESEILSKGALDEHATKVFRGNLIFDKGASESVGKEKEYVMLLSERVRNHSIPALLCSEDDVIGEHAASIGKIDQEKLFYLMSRGLNEIEAKKMVIKASFEEIFNEIPIDSIRSGLTETLDRRLKDELQGQLSDL